MLQYTTALFVVYGEVSKIMLVFFSNEEYLEYDKRCVIMKYVVVVGVTCLLIPITLVINVINVDLPWLFLFNGILVGGAVLPIVLGNNHGENNYVS